MSLFGVLVRPRRTPQNVNPPAVLPSDGGQPPEYFGGVTGRLSRFNRRVRLVVEVLDDPDELALATEALAACEGWRVRSAEPRDRAAVQEGYVALFVDVSLRSAKHTAVSVARDRVMTIAEQQKIGMRVRQATLVAPDRGKDTTTYYAYRKPPEDLGLLRRWFVDLWRSVGGMDVHRSLRLPGGPSDAQREAARAEFARMSLGGIAFERESHDVRLVMGPKRSERTQEHSVWLLGAMGAGIAAGLLLCGALLDVLSTPWRFLALVPPSVACWPTGSYATSNEPRPWLVRLGAGCVLMGGPVFVGYQWSAGQAGGISRQLAGIAIAGLTFLLACGVWYALSHSWFSRNLSWLLPVLVAPLPFVLPWVGGFLHTVYLTDSFGIPAETVHIAFYWKYLIALKPLGIAMLVMFLFVALYGWARHFHWGVGHDGFVFVSLMVFLLAILYGLTVASVALQNTTTAAERAMRAAVSGERPPAYYGLRSELMCVRPTGGEPTAVNGPVPTSHPVLAFQPTGDYVWVWDPASSRGSDSTRHAVRLRAEEISLSLAEGTRCPSVKGG